MNVDRFYTTGNDTKPVAGHLKTMYRIFHGHVQFQIIAPDGECGYFCLEPALCREIANTLLAYAERAEAHPESVGGGA